MTRLSSLLVLALALAWTWVQFFFPTAWRDSHDINYLIVWMAVCGAHYVLGGLLLIAARVQRHLFKLGLPLAFAPVVQINAIHFEVPWRFLLLFGPTLLASLFAVGYLTGMKRIAAPSVQ